MGQMNVEVWIGLAASALGFIVAGIGIGVALKVWKRSQRLFHATVPNAIHRPDGSVEIPLLGAWRGRRGRLGEQGVWYRTATSAGFGTLHLLSDRLAWGRNGKISHTYGEVCSVDYSTGPWGARVGIDFLEATARWECNVGNQPTAALVVQHLARMGCPLNADAMRLADPMAGMKCAPNPQRVVT